MCLVTSVSRNPCVARQLPSRRESRAPWHFREVNRKPLPFGGYDDRLRQAFRALALDRATNDRYRLTAGFRSGERIQRNMSASI